MIRVLSVYDRMAAAAERADGGLSTLARLVFMAVLWMYFWASGLTKLGDGPLGIFVPSAGAYSQIFPRAAEAAGYDISQLSAFHTIVVLAGTWAEVLLPLLIVLGALTRLAALGMIGFVIVQSLTDVIGHNLLAEPATVGAWFDRMPGALILDQRALWCFLLVVLVAKGAGPLSLDRLLIKRHRAARPSGVPAGAQG